MAKDLEWEVIARRWDPASRSCILDLRDRIEKLEAAQNPRQQDEDVERVAGDPQPIATVEELLRCYGWAFMEAVQKGDAAPEATELALRAVYDLGRKHGATQATCPHIRKSDDGTGYCSLAEKTADSQPTPNDRQIRSSAPTVGLVERLGSVPDVWSKGKPLHPAARRAAIHHIADWLELQQEVPIGSTASADYFAAMLRSEANQ